MFYKKQQEHMILCDTETKMPTIRIFFFFKHMILDDALVIRILVFNQLIFQLD